MSHACHQPHEHLLAKRRLSPEEQAVLSDWVADYQEALRPLRADLAGALADMRLDNPGAIRGSVRSLVRELEAEFETVFHEGAREGARAGRALAVRRHDLAIDFDLVPRRVLDDLDEWVDVAVGSTLDTITDDASNWLRGAHEEGLDIDDIADRLNEELFEGRLEDHVAERAARTGTVSTSNVGTHTAHEEAPGVIAERWLATGDDRTRESHAAAHGQVVGVDRTFEVGGSFLRHPGDPRAPLEELVNCRCTTTPVFADDLTEAERKAIRAGHRLWL